MNQPSQYRMIIHTQGGVPGHFFVELQGPDGRDVMGFQAESAIKASSLSSVDGEVKDDEYRLKEDADSIKSSKSISLTPEQFDKVSSFFEEAENDDSDSNKWKKYDLNDNNCVDFANEAVKRAGLKGDVDDYLSTEQRDQMSGAAAYSNYKYAQDRIKARDEKFGSGLQGEVGGWPGEEGKNVKPDASTKGAKDKPDFDKSDPEPGFGGADILQGGAGDDDLSDTPEP